VYTCNHVNNNLTSDELLVPKVLLWLCLLWGDRNSNWVACCPSPPVISGDHGHLFSGGMPTSSVNSNQTKCNELRRKSKVCGCTDLDGYMYTNK